MRKREDGFDDVAISGKGHFKKKRFCNKTECKQEMIVGKQRKEDTVWGRGLYSNRTCFGAVGCWPIVAATCKRGGQ